MLPDQTSRWPPPSTPPLYNHLSQPGSVITQPTHHTLTPREHDPVQILYIMLLFANINIGVYR